MGDFCSAELEDRDIEDNIREMLDMNKDGEDNRGIEFIYGGMSNEFWLS